MYLRHVYIIALRLGLGVFFVERVDDTVSDVDHGINAFFHAAFDTFVAYRVVMKIILGIKTKRML